MATYIVRVQLTNEMQQNYTILKSALIKSGFSKKITAKTGETYILPNGNYLVESNRPLLEILGTVQSILINLGDKRAMILITESTKNGVAWANLPKQR